MKIAINALVLKSAGNITYFSNILSEIERQDKENEYFIFLPSKWQGFLNFKPKRLKIIEVGFLTKNLFLREIYEQFILPFKLKLLKIDLLYCPNDVICFFAPCRVILAIRNPNPYFRFTKQPFLLKTKSKIRKILTKISVLKAEKIIFVSNFSKGKISQHLKIKKEKMITIYHGINQKFFNEVNEEKIEKKWREKIDNLFPYILSISNLYPHKNFEVLIKAYNNLDKEFKNKYRLVIAGELTFPNYFLKLGNLVKKHSLENKIIFLGQVPYKIIPYLYKKSVLFVLPSILETFGHTLVEAMTAGVPLVASNSTAISEIVGEGGILFNPNNSKELTKKITVCLKNDKIRERLIEKGFEKARQFSWQRNVDQLLEIFKEVTY